MTLGKTILEIAADLGDGRPSWSCLHSHTMSSGNPSRSSEYFLAWTVEFLHLITSPHFYADWLGFAGGLVGLSIMFLSLVGTALALPRFRWLLLGLWSRLSALWPGAPVPDVHTQLLSPAAWCR